MLSRSLLTIRGGVSYFWRVLVSCGGNGLFQLEGVHLIWNHEEGVISGADTLHLEGVISGADTFQQEGACFIWRGFI